MPELRKDPIVGRWVIIATERARRPGNFIDSQANIWDHDLPCPFCPQGEDGNKPEIYSHKNGDQWQVKVVSSGTPILKPNGPAKRRGRGIYDIINGIGTHEVVIETPEHIANMADLSPDQIRLVIEAYGARFRALDENPDYKYVLAYKNYGFTAGSRRIPHARSQIIAAPVIPLRVKEKLIGAKKYFDHRERCIYCDLIAQERDHKLRVITENDQFIAIAPFAARFLSEAWILPKKHGCDFAKDIAGKEMGLAKILKEMLQRIKIGLDDPAYNFVLHTAPIGRDYSDPRLWSTIDEDYHWHIELMPRLTRVAGFEKGTGFYICSIPPEYSAEYLRGVEIKT